MRRAGSRMSRPQAAGGVRFVVEPPEGIALQDGSSIKNLFSLACGPSGTVSCGSLPFVGRGEKTRCQRGCRSSAQPRW